MKTRITFIATIVLLVPIVSFGQGAETDVKAEFVQPSDTSSTYTLVKVESAVEGREIPFSGRLFDPLGTLNIDLEEGERTPFERRLVADEFIGLFRNLDADVGMVVSLANVKNDSTKAWLKADWNYTMVMKRGDEILTSGL